MTSQKFVSMLNLARFKNVTSLHKNTPKLSQLNRISVLIQLHYCSLSACKTCML